jgi:triosephosphate isomerase
MRPIVGASWKMHLTPSEAAAYLRTLLPLVADVTDRDLFVLPAFPALFVARDLLVSSNVAWGAQDVHPEDAGPFTGDVSAPMLADLGAEFVEVGHPERRRHHAETLELVAAKVAAVLRWGMSPVICVGEEVRTDRATAIAVVLAQLERLLGAVSAAELGRVVIAYEPEWAIGVAGTRAEPAEVGAVHAAVHQWLAERGGRGEARVIYGGSVDERGAVELLCMPGVDGLFVGRASLDPAVFAAIAHTPTSGPPTSAVRFDALRAPR